ncbi:hypothetical protein pdam_00012458, partial [Pocillopora damicornis]
MLLSAPESIIVVIVIRLGSLHLLVIFLQSSKIFTRFNKLSFLHAFADIPVNKRAFSKHQIELVIQTSPRL